MYQDVHMLHRKAIRPLHCPIIDRQTSCSKSGLRLSPICLGGSIVRLSIVLCLGINRYPMLATPDGIAMA